MTSSSGPLQLVIPPARHHEGDHIFYGSPILRRVHRTLVSDCAASRDERVPEGWGRLSLVCPQETTGAPSHHLRKGFRPEGALANRRVCSLHCEIYKTNSLPLPPPPPKHTPLTCSNSSVCLDTDNGCEMSSGGGIGSAATSYSSLRRGFKATTSKLMSATTVRRPGNTPPSFERGFVTERGDPNRFIEGLSFKGKLIGVLEVSEARGDRMCQEALAELKTAVRAAGEHKQRIAISVAMDGIRLTDERTGDCLYHHPVHKISFIAQDMTDTRAFGYIFGSPDAGHKFFGIKTEKAASQVVIAMRDLFQVVFENKKKDLENARAKLEEGRDGKDFKDGTYSSLFETNGEPGIVSASLTSGAGGAIADLLDLQSELTSLQRGLSEISKRTQFVQKQQNQAKEEHMDPFGDSFKPGAGSSTDSAPKSSRITVASAPTPAPLAPPPISGRSRHDSHKSQSKSADFAKFPVDFKNLTQPPVTSQPSCDRYAVFKEIKPHSEQTDTHRKSIGSVASVDSAKRDETDPQWGAGERVKEATGPQGTQSYDLFTELDPLGTGKIKPFVDKKDFFNDVRKQTSRRLLRGIGDGEESLPGSPKVPPGVIPPEVSALVASSSLYTGAGTTPTPSQPPTSTHTTPVHSSVAQSFGDSFLESSEPPSSGGFADFNQFTDSPRSQRSEFSSGSAPDEPPTSLSVGSLTVALPPESFRDSPPSFSPPHHSPARSTSGSNSPQLAVSQQSPLPRSRLLNQTKRSASPISPKTLPRSHRFPRQDSYESSWEPVPHFSSSRFGPSEPEFSSAPSAHQGEGGISPRPRPRSNLSRHTHLGSGSATLPLRGSCGKGSYRGQTSSSGLECHPFPSDEINMSYEEAPVPPPRPAHVEPPPLPPKRLPSHITLRPPPRPPPSSEPHYNYINDYDSSPEDPNARSPPIPIPARKPRYPEAISASSYVPNRAAKAPTSSDGFQFPKASHSPTGAVPKASSRSSTPSKSSTPGKSPRGTQRGLTPESVDLANTSLDQLASTLNVPVDQLAQMTVVELAACLAQLQLRGDIVEPSAPPRSDDGYEVPNNLNRNFETRRSRKGSEDWSSEDKFNFNETEDFARFDAQFPKSPVDNFPTQSTRESKTKFPLGAPVSEDRYAVFRELSSPGKQKSVFDEHLLTPQNSAEDEELSSGTFKATFRNHSLEPKSSFSDDPDTCPDIAPDRIDHECVTVFRSPDISEYENFAPDFECKFEDDFSAATLSERSTTPVNSPPAASTIAKGAKAGKSSAAVHKSPFTDDFSKSSIVSSLAKSDEKFPVNFNDTTQSLGSGRGSSALSTPSGRRSTSERSPFEDDFSEMHIRQRTLDDSSMDDVFEIDGERRSKQIVDRPSRRRSKKASSFDSSHGLVSCEKPVRSPFDDDFSQRTSKYEVLRDLDAERASPFDDHDDQKSIGSLQSIQEEAKATFERRRSPYSETLTPPSYALRSRGPSRVSVGSEGSGEVSQNLFEDNFNPTIDNGPKVPCRETAPIETTPVESHQKASFDEEKALDKEEKQINFADFENAFQDDNVSYEEYYSITDEGTEDKHREVEEKATEEPQNLKEDKTNNSKVITFSLEEEEEVVFPEEETEFKVSARFPKPESENIFRRDSDPFSDDFFDEETISEHDQSLTLATDAKDPFWEESFGSFKFTDG